MKVTMYYGLSGALKGSTIKAVKGDDPVMESAIKPWKYYQFGLFKDLTEYTDLTYSILHLVRLREFVDRNRNSDSIIVERGITDSLFYYYNGVEFSSPEKVDLDLVYRAVKEEKLLLPEQPRKVLLIQGDYNFVKDVVFQDEFRKKTFKGSPELYFEQQEKYVNWTCKFNAIDEIKRIDNAEDYIQNVLGETLKIKNV